MWRINWTLESWHPALSAVLGPKNSLGEAFLSSDHLGQKTRRSLYTRRRKARSNLFELASQFRNGLSQFKKNEILFWRAQECKNF